MNVRPLMLLVVLMQGVASAQGIPDAAPSSGAAAGSGTAVRTIDTRLPASHATTMGSPSGNESGAASIALASPGTGFPDDGAAPAGIPNPSIDMGAYLRISMEAAAYRQSHRLSEEDFLRMSGEPGTIVLDARSAEKYRLLHVKGAINLSFSDITVDSLKQTIPDLSTRVLIYCNNNFTGAQKAFPTKLPSASLNLSTYVALYNYGYRNVYELGPTVDLKASKLVFEGTE
jgi:hypothetical protein